MRNLAFCNQLQHFSTLILTLSQKCCNWFATAISHTTLEPTQLAEKFVTVEIATAFRIKFQKCISDKKSPPPAFNYCLIKSVTEVESKDSLDDVILVSVSEPTQAKGEQEN